MAKQVLPTNFMDDILNESMNGKRRWTITPNDDGTYTLEDATTYDQIGNTFGQAQVNEMNKAINESVDQARVIDDYKTLAAVNQNGFVPGAKPVAQLISELGTGGGEMSLKSMVSELYGKLANFDLVVDISKYFSTNTAQIFEVKSSADLSGYEYIAICATFQKGKTGNFTEISGCQILDQLGWSHITSSDEVAIHLVILKNITGAISILGRYGGTGSATVKAFGFK
uniref:Uncharacterized protein n=1 Tax=Myoviridae sp. ct2Qy24 TaxID=2827656 RepID=A0A8S5SSF1_9CAUD|nr:MAG TPA: hypothetical protein [Myoviridae sp. ct2Qy24]